MQKPNILLVVLDATRADVCSCYGAGSATTPNLDKLAAEGILFEQAISPAPWTLPAMTSLFTGLYPGQTGINLKRKLAPSYPTLAQVLAEEGYATFGITNNGWLSADFGLQRGFATLHKQWQWLQTPQEINFLVLIEGARHSNWNRNLVRKLFEGNVIKNSLNTVYARFLANRRDLGALRILRPLQRWIASRRGPWFAFVHYLEAHLPYKPPQRWAARFVSDLEQAQKWIGADQWRMAWRHMAGEELLSEAELAIWRDLYRAEVAYADHRLGQLIRWLRHSGRLDDTLVIVVADHGESLGEHGLLNHQYGVYDTLLRVPLVMRYPAQLPTGQRISHQVQTLDIFGTVLDLVGIETLPTASRNLLSEQERRSYTIAEYAAPRIPHPKNLAHFGLQPEQLRPFERGFTALRTDTHKLIVGTDGSVQLYAWREDPGEEHNLASRYPEMVRTLQAELRRWREEQEVSPGEETEQSWEADPATVARLQALGYIA